MHAVVMESLEDYLSGTLEPVVVRDIEAHLNVCEMCREEMQSMREASALFGSLKCEEEWQASSGFFAGVLEQVGAQTKIAAPSFASFFNLDFAFGRRLVFASLMTLALLGGYLVSHESDYVSGPSPDAVMAQQDSPTFESAPAQDAMLLTLTAYEQR